MKWFFLNTIALIMTAAVILTCIFFVSCAPVIQIIEATPSPSPIATPEPSPEPSPEPYTLYALYEVRVFDGSIILEDHPASENYAKRLQDFKMDIELQNTFHPSDPWTLITGRLYP